MKTITSSFALFAAVMMAAPTFAQSSSSSPVVASSPVAAPNAAGQPDQAEMMKQMMELSKINENHKLLSSLDGNWSYNLKFWMNGPTSKPEESKGTATRRSVMDGRYVIMDVTGKMNMPDATGKPHETVFKGMGTEGYDNVKKKFVGSWIDNMGTGIESSEGTYDPASKTMTYTAEIEEVPGMKQQAREVIKFIDKDHMTLEWYQNQNGQEQKTMEINYTRSGKAKS